MTPFFVVQTFIDYLRKEKRFSAHTLIAYQKDLEQFFDFAEINSDEDITEVESPLIRGWMVELIEKGISNRTVNRKISTLRSFYKYFLAQKGVEANPLRKVKAPKVQKRLPSFVKENEITSVKTEQLFTDDFDGKRDRLMFELFYQCGIRLNELITLQEKNIHSDAIRVIGKRNKERIIPISASLHDLIRDFRKIKEEEQIVSSYLLVLKNGKDLYPKLVYRRINYYLGSITSLDKKSPHVLRHTFATHLLNNGAGLETLKELLGHANLSATQVYTHNSFKELTNIYSQAHPRGAQKN